MVLQLFQGGKEMLASDGVMYVDGRLSLHNISEAVKERNKRFEKHMPHKIADAFSIYSSRIGSTQHSYTKL